MERKEPAPRSEPEKASRGSRPTKRQTLWAVGMVVALLVTVVLAVNLYPGIGKSLLERRTLMLLALGVSLTAIVVLLAVGGAASSWTGFRWKTLWDLLQLLIVPLVLATIGFVFTVQQDARQTAIENQRAEQARKLADLQANEERKIADRRTEQVTLQAYLDQMGTLLLPRRHHARWNETPLRFSLSAFQQELVGKLDLSRVGELGRHPRFRGNSRAFGSLSWAVERRNGRYATPLLPDSVLNAEVLKC